MGGDRELNHLRPARPHRVVASLEIRRSAVEIVEGQHHVPSVAPGDQVTEPALPLEVNPVRTLIKGLL